MPAMKYLLYFEDGIVRKYPLGKNIFTIGRAAECELSINEGFVSRKHVQVSVAEDHVHVTDLNSKNGLFYKGGRVHEARIAVNESFCLKTLEIYLKEGETGELAAAPELTPVFKQMGRRAADRVRDIETRYVEDASMEVLKQLLSDGLKARTLNDFFLSLSNYLSIFNDFGDLLVTCGEPPGLAYSYRHSGNESALLSAVNKAPASGASGRRFEPLPGKPGACFLSLPLVLHDKPARLLYFPPVRSSKPPAKTEKFLLMLAREIELVAQLTLASPGKWHCQESGEDNNERINTGDPRMKRLIAEAKRIAASELSVVIEGESGTGKELFARLLHSHSPRSRMPFIAVNCAAIPENLLESEFFGHERGAFTGALAQKVGKLELASGGILVLDEISEMPSSLQAKLLRALEEHEFFRVGGVSPIKVNLRIISLTNSRLQEMVNGMRFRADLFYRLAHHIITLPPLRERRTDIHLLINHFTRLFARQYDLDIKGYTVKAFRALEEYHWPGNVRQLKNEVHRLLNLAGDGGMIDFDLLSETIRHPHADGESPAAQAILLPGEDERAMLLRLLAKNQGNKSRTARDLGMTYQGLHKKMRRLKIHQS